MPFDILSLKGLARRTVHNTFGVPATYQDHTMSEPAGITARWHDKIVVNGDPDNEGFAQVVQTIDRIVLIPSDTPDIDFIRLGRVKILNTGKIYVLDVMEDPTGPLERIWRAREA